MTPRLLLRLEGALVLITSIFTYSLLDASWVLFAVLLLGPDAFMVGYLVGPVVGALIYNAGHTYTVPLVLGALAYSASSPLTAAVALIWTAHIGMDRALGYGLKEQTGFHDTHLNARAESRAASAHASY